MGRRRRGIATNNNDSPLESAEVKNTLAALTTDGVKIVDGLKVLQAIQSLSPRTLEAILTAAAANPQKISPLQANYSTRWAGNLNAFGTFCKRFNLSREAIAKRFDVSPAYVSMLTHVGKATPGLKLAMEIKRWTEESGFPEIFGPEKWGL